MKHISTSTQHLTGKAPLCYVMFWCETPLVQSILRYVLVRNTFGAKHRCITLCFGAPLVKSTVVLSCVLVCIIHCCIQLCFGAKHSSTVVLRYVFVKNMKKCQVHSHEKYIQDYMRNILKQDPIKFYTVQCCTNHPRNISIPASVFKDLGSLH